MMKRLVLLLALMSLMVTGCSGKQTADASAKAPDQTVVAEPETNQSSSAEVEQKEPGITVSPLPDTTMENLTDAILAVSFEKGDVYVDDTGKLQMDAKIYTYDKYDLADISGLKVGDTLVTHGGEVEVSALDKGENGTLYINGGLEDGGFDLVTDDSSIFFESGFDDAKNWYQVGEATIRVSADFEGHDSSDPEQGEAVIYPGSFLNEEVTDYNFTPHNTTVRVEEGQIVELTRIYTP